MDLDACALSRVAASDHSVSPGGNAVDNSCHSRPVLDRDPIRWLNIDGPWSLTVAWKKLVSMSVQFKQESKNNCSFSQSILTCTSRVLWQSLLSKT